MSSLSEDQISEHKEAFMLFDRRGDGKIESAQLGEVLRSLGLNPTQADVKKVLNEVDPKGNKRIAFEEFLPIFLSIGQKKPIHSSSEGFVDGLRVFDREGNGQISAAELRHVLTGLGERMTDEEVDLLVSGQEDQQGQINYEEFVKMVMSG
ncbi:myosin-2 essential light chain-like [Montipora capricornis]|uniref:myosin-2 essential light chain-like n=1 Tax=Montipora capricornis TaxID=246305 RepID=UPI0035F10297